MRDLTAWWMPFTANRNFKEAPRLFVSAEGMYYRTDDGRQILDGTAGLWCVNAGHAQPRITQAICDGARRLDFAPTFQMGHPTAFELAERLIDFAGGKFSQVFYTNSGSEAIDTALKMALAYHRVRGDGTRTRLIGRERGYHGVGLGGISDWRHSRPTARWFALSDDSGGRSPATHARIRRGDGLQRTAARRWGAHLADRTGTDMVALHDASTIAAVIVEPIAGFDRRASSRPAGYLEAAARNLQRSTASC